MDEEIVEAVVERISSSLLEMVNELLLEYREFVLFGGDDVVNGVKGDSSVEVFTERYSNLVVEEICGIVGDCLLDICELEM